MKKIFITLMLIALSSTSLLSAPQHFTIDPAHSNISFRARHFISKVVGSFKEFSGEISFDKIDVSKSKVKLTIHAASIETYNEERDDHLRTDDFLFTESFPIIEFESVSWLQQDINTFEIFGYLTMRGIKLPLTFNLNLIDMANNRQGQLVSGWEGKGKLDRTEWDMNYGAPALGSEVEFEFQIEAIQQ